MRRPTWKGIFTLIATVSKKGQKMKKNKNNIRTILLHYNENDFSSTIFYFENSLHDSHFKFTNLDVNSVNWHHISVSEFSR